MIDTIRVFFPHRMSRGLPDGWSSRSAWYCRDQKPSLGREACKQDNYKHNATGMFVSGPPGMIEYVTTSLPKLLYGTNCKLIKSQAELDAAMIQFRGLLLEFGTPIVDEPYFTRVDLVWQFRGNPADFVSAHRHSRHKHIRKSPEFYDDSSIRFKGSEMNVCIYDKQREQKREKVMSFAAKFSSKVL